MTAKIEKIEKFIHYLCNFPEKEQNRSKLRMTLNQLLEGVDKGSSSCNKIVNKVRIASETINLVAIISIWS